MEQILQAYGLPKETSHYVDVLQKHENNGDTNLFDIVTGVLQRDTLAPFLFIICLDYVLRASIESMKENVFLLKK